MDFPTRVARSLTVIAFMAAASGVTIMATVSAQTDTPPPCTPVPPPARPSTAARSNNLGGLPDRYVAPKEPHHYLYFAQREIYYAPETLQWFWQSGGRWNYGANLPIGYGPQVGVAGIPITLMTERPFQEHAEVVRRYGDRNHVKTDEERRAAEKPGQTLKPSDWKEGSGG